MHRNVQKIGSRDEGLPEAEVEEAIATCGGDVRAALRATLVANAYLEAEIERLTEAISTGFRARADAQGASAGEEDVAVDAADIVRSVVLSCNDYG